MSTSNQPVTDVAPADLPAETAPVGGEVEDSVRRAALSHLGKMAALTSPTLLTLLLSDRASAESPPLDPA